MGASALLVEYMPPEGHTKRAGGHPLKEKRIKTFEIYGTVGFLITAEM